MKQSSNWSPNNGSILHSSQLFIKCQFKQHIYFLKTCQWPPIAIRIRYTIFAMTHMALHCLNPAPLQLHRDPGFKLQAHWSFVPLGTLQAPSCLTLPHYSSFCLEPSPSLSTSLFLLPNSFLPMLQVPTETSLPQTSLILPSLKPECIPCPLPPSCTHTAPPPNITLNYLISILFPAIPMFHEGKNCVSFVSLVPSSTK